MTAAVVLTAAGCASATGFGGSLSGWSLRPLPAGGAAALRWNTVSDAPFDRFGRLDALSKLVLVAAEMTGLPPAPGGAGQPEMAVCLGTRCGSLGADLDFLRSIAAPGGASPALFSYTLPSTAIGEAAIRYRLAGPNLCLLAGAESGWLAFWEGLELVSSGEAAGCLCLGGDALPPAAAELLGHGDAAVETQPDFAYAFVVEEERAARNRSRAALADLSIRREVAPAAGQGSLSELYRFLAHGDQRRLCLTAPAALGIPGTLAVERR